MISASLELSVVQERLKAAIYQASCRHWITLPRDLALYSYCVYEVLSQSQWGSTGKRVEAQVLFPNCWGLPGTA